jgi:hypothetical protein
MGAERDRVSGLGRLENGLRQAGDWCHWGPYVSERQWGTVREDYSADGIAWTSFPHDHARARVYRWGEDGLAGWYLDAVPSHAWNRWRYHYPQGAFPYEDLCRENRRRGRLDPEYELLDTGAFDGDRYWIVEVDTPRLTRTTS